MLKKHCPPRLFLCHSSADKEFVDFLAKELVERDIRIWYDKWEIKVGDSIIDKINEGLGVADYLVIVLSQASVQSRWVREELNAATMRRINKDGAHILPVLIESCNIPPLLSHLRYADFRENWETGLKDLLAAVIPNKDKLIASLKAIYHEIKRIIDNFHQKFEDSVPFEEMIELDQLLIEAVNIRCLYEQSDHLHFLPQETNLYDQMSFLENIGIKLRSSAWSLLRECRSELFHSSKYNKYSVSQSKLRKLRGGMSEIHRIARRICKIPMKDFGIEQSSPPDRYSAGAP